MAQGKLTLVAILLAVATTEAVALQKIPKFLHICDLKMENYEACLIESIMILKSAIKIGIPEYKVPAFEPFFMKELKFLIASTLQFHAKNITVYETSNFIISSLKVNSPKLNISLEILLPQINFKGDYNMDGQILIIPVKGFGTFYGNFSDNKCTCNIESQLYNDTNGVQKIRIINFYMKIIGGKGSIVFNNQSNADKTLNDILNTTIKNNISFFLNKILPNLTELLSNKIRATANIILGQFAFDELFPHYWEVAELEKGITSGR